MGMIIAKRALAWLVVLAVVLTFGLGVTSVFATDSGSIDGISTFDENDKTPSKLNIKGNNFRNCEFLSVKVKSDDFSSIRLVSVCLSWLLNSSEDYGYFIYSFDKSDGLTASDLAQNLEERLSSVKPDAEYSCKGTENAFVRGDYGNSSFNYRSDGYSKYKYVTMKINNIPDDKLVVARFYLKKDGEYRFATYNSTEKACVYSTTDILNIVKPRMELVGHRGAMDVAPQNTFASFEQAAKYGYPFVEADFWVTNTRDFLVLHDDVLNVCGFPQIPVKTLDNESRFNFPVKDGTLYQNYKTQYIPTVEELVSKVSNLNLKLFLHIKDGGISEERLDEVFSIVKKYGMLDKTVFVTSSRRCCKKLSNRSCNRCFLINEPDGKSIDEGFKYCAEHGVQRVMVRFRDGYPTAQNIKKAHKLGLKIGAFDANSVYDTLWLMRHNCDFSMINNWM